MSLVGLLIDQRSLVTDGSSLAAVPLLRGHEPDGAVAVLMHVPGHESGLSRGIVCLNVPYEPQKPAKRDWD
jgi:hypothetical protein